jgi:hypothetical protein
LLSRAQLNVSLEKIPRIENELRFVSDCDGTAISLTDIALREDRNGATVQGNHPARSDVEFINCTILFTQLSSEMEGKRDCPVIDETYRGELTMNALDTNGCPGLSWQEMMIANSTAR